MKCMSETKRLRAQVDAEIEFGLALERYGMDYEQIQSMFNLSKHQLNVIAHYIKGVNDEAPPAIFAAFQDVLKSSQLSKTLEVAAV